MSAQRKVEKNQEAIRKLSLIEKNKTCMDCTLKSTPYVVLDFGTFVCTFCAGIHRQHEFKSKGISMTNFKDTEVDFMKTHGNEKAENAWRANWDEKKFPKPKITEEAKIKKFIYDTYVAKKYQGAGVASPQSPSNEYEEESIPEPQPIHKIIKEPTRIEVTRHRASSKSVEPQKSKQSDNFFEFTQERSTTTTTAKTAAKKQDDLFGGDDFFSSASTTNNGVGESGFGDDGDFEVDFSQASISDSHTTKTTQPPAQPKKSGLSLADELFANIPSTQPTYGGGVMSGHNMAAPAHQSGGLDDFFSAPVSAQQPAYGGNFGNAPYGGGAGYGNQPHQPGFGGGYGNQPHQPGFGGGHHQPSFGGPGPNMGGGYGHQHGFGGGANMGGWNQPHHNQGGYGGNFGHPQPQQFNNAPQLNPAFQEQPKQQPVNDPFATLGAGFGLSANNAPLKPQNQPAMNTRPAPASNLSSNNTASGFDDNPFDF